MLKMGVDHLSEMRNIPNVGGLPVSEILYT